MKYVYFLDMDGVLANFNKRAKEILGDDFEKCDNNYAWNTLVNYQDLYLDLEPMEDAFLLFDLLKNKDLKILTAIPSKAKFNYSQQHKIEWMKKHFNFHGEVLFGPYSKDKQLYAKNNHVLIDDNILNIKQWVNKKGIAIHHINTENTIKNLQNLNLI